MTNPHSAPRCHHDGWTPDVQTIFLDTLMTSGSVSEAARAAGKTPSSAYKRRAHANGAAFRAAWTAAIGICVEQVRETAIDRAINGRLMPVFRNGVQTGERLMFNDRLLIALMRLYDAPAYHAERVAAAEAERSAAINPVSPPLSRAEMVAQFEAALDRVNREHAAREAENAALALADAALAAANGGALQADESNDPGVSKESPNVVDDGGWVPDDDRSHPYPAIAPGVSKESPKAAEAHDPAIATASPRSDGKHDLGVSKESPNADHAAELGVSKESPNADDAAELGVSKGSPNASDAAKLDVSKESPNNDDASACGVWIDTPMLSPTAEPRRSWRQSG